MNASGRGPVHLAATAIFGTLCATTVRGDAQANSPRIERNNGIVNVTYNTCPEPVPCTVSAPDSVLPEPILRRIIDDCLRRSGQNWKASLQTLLKALAAADQRQLEAVAEQYTKLEDRLSLLQAAVDRAAKDNEAMDAQRRSEYAQLTNSLEGFTKALAEVKLPQATRHLEEAEETMRRYRKHDDYQVDVESLAEGSPGTANPVCDLGVRLAVRGLAVSWDSIGFYLFGGIQYSQRFGTLNYRTPSARTTTLEQNPTTGFGAAGELGVILRTAQRPPKPTFSVDAAMRARSITTNEPDSRLLTPANDSAWGPLLRIWACEGIDWSWRWRLCLGVGAAYERYRPTTVVYDGFGGATAEAKGWYLRPQILLGVEHAP